MPWRRPGDKPLYEPTMVEAYFYTNVLFQIDRWNRLEDGGSNLQIAWIIFLFATCAPFYKHRLTLIPEWICNYIPCEMWGEITYPFLNFNNAAV